MIVEFFFEPMSNFWRGTVSGKAGVEKKIGSGKSIGFRIIETFLDRNYSAWRKRNLKTVVGLAFGGFAVRIKIKGSPIKDLVRRLAKRGADKKRSCICGSSTIIINLINYFGKNF